MNTCIETFSGKLIDLLNPSPDDICIEDIAHSLSMQCRYCGHTKSFYSVAEHCVRMSTLTKIVPIVFLFHDAAEAYVGDVTRPLKNILQPQYSELEKTFQSVIWEAFDLPGTYDYFSELIKTGDLVMMSLEKRDLLSPDVKWEINVPIPPSDFNIINPWYPCLAELEYINRYNALKK